MDSIFQICLSNIVATYRSNRWQVKDGSGELRKTATGFDHEVACASTQIGEMSKATQIEGGHYCRRAQESVAVHACTIIARNNLPQARVLGDSFRQNHPDGTLTALVIDDLAGLLEPTDEPFHALWLEDFGDETQRNQERAAEEGIEGTSRVRRQEREDEESP